MGEFLNVEGNPNGGGFANLHFEQEELKKGRVFKGALAVSCCRCCCCGACGCGCGGVDVIITIKIITNITSIVIIQNRDAFP